MPKTARVLAVARHLPASPAAVWDAFIDTSVWPRWGPSLRQASLEHEGTRLRPGSKGRVQTAIGIWLPFEVTDWEDGRQWSWKVAGVPATVHRVEAVTGGRGVRAVIEVPNWAAVYGPLCWIALGRLGHVAV